MNLKRLAPLSGVAFAILFVASVTVSSVPQDSASNKDWVAAYATSGQQARHLITGLLLVLAGLALATFLTHIWARIAAAREPEPTNPLPVVAAGVAAACMAVGGILMAAPSASPLLFSGPVPGGEVLRLANGLGFGSAGVAGMLAAALAISGLAVQGRSVGFFGARMYRITLAVAVLLVFSLLFVPIVGLLIWSAVVSVRLAREPAGGRRSRSGRNAAVATTVGALVVLAALVAAGCGSSGGGTSTTAAPSKTDFLAQANAICSKGNKATDAAGGQLHHGMSGAQVAAVVNKSFLPAVHSQIDGIRALGAPAGDQSTVSSMLDTAQADLDKLKADPSLVGDSNLFANFAKVAHPYGLTSCAPNS